MCFATTQNRNCHVAVDSPDFQIMEHVGTLQRVSPEEIDHLIIFQLSDAINKGLSDDILKRWLNMLLSVPLVFWVIEPGADRFWKAQNLREILIDHGECAKRSCRQRVLDIAGFKRDTEKALNQSLSSQKVSSMWCKHVQMSKGSEVVSPSFVDCAVTVDKRLLSIDEWSSALA